MAARSKLTPTVPVELPVELIDENPNQPRQKFEDEKQQGLNTSVAKAGVQVPLEVRPIAGGKEQRWQLVKGARRLRAAKSASLKTVPCVLATAQTMRAIHSAQLLENTNRVDLDPVDFGVALYTEYFADQLIALATEQSRDGQAAVDALFEQGHKPVERMVALRDEVCRLAGVTTLSEYLQSGKVRVPMKTVLERAGLHTLSESQTKKLLTPVKQIAPDVLEELLGSGASIRTLTELGRRAPEDQRQAVTDAQRAAGLDDGDVGRALRDILDADTDQSSGATSQMGGGGFGAFTGGDGDGARDGDGDDLRIQPIGGGGKGGSFEPDPSLALLTGPSGNAPKLVTDRSAPARGKTPPAGHGTMSADDFLQFTGALETLINILDSSGAVALSPEQIAEAGVLYGEIAERCTGLGLGALV